MSSSESEDKDLIRHKRHKEKKEKDRRKDEEKEDKRKSKKDSKRHRDRSRSRSRKSSESSSYRSRKNKNKNKKRDEIEELKEKEIKKRIEMENRRKQDDERKKKEDKRIEERNKPKEELTEEEKIKRKKQSRYAKAIALAFLESADEKKNEVLKVDEIMEDFLEDKTNEIVQENITLENINKIESSNITPIQFEFNKIGNVKMPQLPKEFNKNITKNNNKNITQFIIENKNITQIDDEDPLDAFMKTLEKDAVIQDYEIADIINKQYLQRQYDEMAEKEDTVKMIEDNSGDESTNKIDYSKVITFDDIIRNQPIDNKIEINLNNNNNIDLEMKNIEDEEFHKNFMESFKNKKNQEFDPILGYIYNTEEKTDKIIYQEDVNEYLKEEDFMDTEDAWLKAKRTGEKGKELKLVNHAEINYENFRKDLYKEAKEISNLTEEKVIEYRKDHGDIKVRGKNIPKPIFNWYHCGLQEKIINVLHRKGYVEPFPIQAQAIPCVMSGRDVIGIAETGSGKTLAYVLPMLRHVMDQRPLKEGEGPIGLIFAPTRELATQIFSVVRTLCKILNLNVSCVYGGSGIGPQLSELKRGVEIVVCTPGRMIEVLCMNNGKITNLQRVTYVVIDEADRMFDMGFEPQLSRILANIRPDRQTVMFSATFPKQIESLAKKILNKPIEIVVGQRGQSCQNVKQHVEVIDENHKLIRLLQILGEYSEYYFEEDDKKIQIGIIIFVDQQTEADELYKELFQRGYQPLLIHGGQDQEDRNFAIYDFKTGVRNILISTSVCARGLDVKHCGLVINFKCPNHMEDYVHRVGRTGRAGRKGVAYTFISQDEKHLAEDIVRVLEVSKQEVPDELLQLVRVYREQVQSGEAEKHRYSGYYGRGFEFSNKERESSDFSRKELGKGYSDLLMIESDEEEDKNIEKSGEKSTEKSDQLALIKKNIPQNALVLRKRILSEKEKLEERRKALLKDKRAQQISLDVGANAVKNAIISGKSEEEALQIAQEAIERVLNEYIPSQSTEKGSEQAAKIIEEWVERENVKNNVFTCELDINEYPVNARSRVMKKDFLSNINELSGCNVTLRGVYVEPGKKPPLGNKRLHLHISGSSKQDVMKAYKEIKQVLDEAALMYYTTGNQGYSGNVKKYNL